MFRLLGILLGSAIAVALLILLVGIPQISSDREPERVAIQLPLKPEPIAEPVAATPADTVSSVEPETSPAPADSMDTVDAPAPEPAYEPVAEAVPIPVDVPTDPQWYAFWSPFRSQIAANGFVEQLQRVTGLDYRVVSVKPGVYEVAFAYDSEDEIQANLSQISAATGLDMPDS